MFDKLKNIKLSFGKKSKKNDVADSSLDDDFFSASDSGEEEDFFSEPTFGAEGIEGTDEAPGGPGEIGFSDSLEDTISTPDKFGDSSKVFSEEDLLKSSKVVKGGSGRRTFLLFILFLVFSGYAAYTYILPEYYPDLLEQLTVMIEEQISGKKEAPKRVAVKKKVPPKPAPARPAPPKPVPVKPPVEPVKATAAASAEPGTAEKSVLPVQKAPEKTAVAVTKAAPDAVPPAVKGDVKAPKKEEAPQPVPEKTESETVAAKPAGNDKKVAAPVKAPQVSEKKVAAPVKPAPVPAAVSSGKAAKDIKITKGSIPVSARGYYLQTGVYIFKGNLRSPRKTIESLGYTPIVKAGRKIIKMNRLLVGEWGDFLAAEDLVKKLRQNGFNAELISKNERFSALIGSFYYKHMADKKKSALRKKGFNARIEKTPINMKVHHLLVGPYNTPEEADSVLDSLKRKGFKAVIIQKK